MLITAVIVSLTDRWTAHRNISVRTYYCHWNKHCICSCLCAAHCPRCFTSVEHFVFLYVLDYKRPAINIFWKRQPFQKHNYSKPQSQVSFLAIISSMFQFHCFCIWPDQTNSCWDLARSSIFATSWARSLKTLLVAQLTVVWNLLEAYLGFTSHAKHKKQVVTLASFSSRIYAD